MTSADDDQLALVPPLTASGRRARPRPKAAAAVAAPSAPVARVAVDTRLAHLDRPFDYLVPAALHDAVVAGCRVKVRFAGALVDGFVLERVERSAHEGRLAFLAKVVSAEPVLTPEVLALARAVADRCAGTLADVLRLAIPPRHARAEAVASPAPPPAPASPDGASWAPYEHGTAFVEALVTRGPRACWSALPGHDPALAVAEAVRATLSGGRGAIVCVPDVRDVARFEKALGDVLGMGHHVTLTGAQRPGERYASYLALSRGAVRAVVGTRAAAFAPAADLGLVVVWDDGDDLLSEPRAPYAHARDVLLLRAAQADAAVLIGGYARSAEAQSLVENGWCTTLEAEPTVRRQAWADVRVADSTQEGPSAGRLPHAVIRAVRAAAGPVLVQVPRRGYRTSLACQQCREPARCRTCDGPLGQPSASAPVTCRWCGGVDVPWACRECGDRRLRAPVVGQLRTAEELARTFPEHEIITSGGNHVLAEVGPGPRIVLATPGAEPHLAGGYALVVLLDTWLMLARDDVRVVEESHRRWFNALALAAPGATAIAVGDPTVLQALVRADPAGAAARELAERIATHLPPVARLATVDGPPDAVAALTSGEWTPHAEVLGPVPLDDETQRLIVRVPRVEAARLAAILKDAQARRSAAKLSPLRVQIDPLQF